MMKRYKFGRKLPKDFTLPFKKTFPNELKFMPGAKDGIGIFHFGAKSSEKVSKKIVKLLKVTVKRVVSAHKMKLRNF